MIRLERHEIRPCLDLPLWLCEIFRNGRNEILFSLVIYCVNIFIVGNFFCAGCRQNDKACNTPTVHMDDTPIHLFTFSIKNGFNQLEEIYK